MNNSIKEISYKNLIMNFKIPDFKITKEIPPFRGIIGQEQAERSLDMGLQINKKEYNIYISGHSGTGKTSYIINKIENYAKTIKSPLDWCYVFNFEDENTPSALSFPSGEGKQFKLGMENLIDYLYREVPICFSSNTYEQDKNNIISKYEKQILDITDKLNSTARNMDLLIKEDSEEGFVFVPIKDGKELVNEDYNKLNNEEKNNISNNAAELRLISIDTIKQTKILERNMENEILKLDNKMAEKLLGKKFNILKDKYSKNKKVLKYLDHVKDDLIENIQEFLEDNLEKVSIDKESDNARLLENILDHSVLKRYEVNVLVSNNPLNGPPVIFENSCDYHSLFGKIEYENKMGNLVTDFTHIKAGNIHRANGGFLIINAQDLLNNLDSYEYLKRVLKNEKITIENTRGSLEILPIVSLKTEEIPINLKIIIIGSELVYSILLNHDEDFEKLFKIKAEFDSELENNEKNIYEILGYINNYVDANDFHHIEKSGIIELLTYGARLAENKNYITSSIGKLLDIIDIANFFAKKDKKEIIEKKHIIEALKENIEMHSITKYKILKMYKENRYLLNTKGSLVGEINGLCVINLGDIEIGMAHKITVTTYAGRKGIINIEREAKMSGNIHNKSVMILSGFIGEMLGSDTHLSFNASIVFEQLYSGIEGDSASCAELIALLSSLSNIPIKQNIAITGSINQKGEVQPIGGVNEKIEGFFDICNLNKMDGSNGVIIPKLNVEDLILKDEVLQAIKNGLFHIYPVDTIEDCLSVLCDEDLITSSDESLISLIKQRSLSKLNKFNTLLNYK
ncbi:Lon protease family protein [Hathewaya histolytica]|uniref:Lon protease family protein n=1 Tax=Hathewaya histolytica TaxID=1498 RepID=UPI003B67E92C